MVLDLRAQVNLSYLPNEYGYICIFCHFYQPPRTNPFTGIIEHEYGTGGFGNFNELICHECYSPLIEAGVFRSITFNLAPTLALWLEQEHPTLYKKIQEDEAWHRRKFGASNAVAQPYNHSIVPLLSSAGYYRDWWLQIQWGIAAYKHMFGHDPDGMWFSEAAISYQALYIASRCGIKYTILRPSQAKFPVDCTMPYRTYFYDGRGEALGSIDVFFYDPDISGNITHSNSAAFKNADAFLAGLPKHEDKYAPVRILAMDGETYGHHKEGGEKFLAYLVKPEIAEHHGFALASLGFLHKHYSPEHDVVLHNNSSWSCGHGLKRWETGCDCQDSGGYPAWRNWKQVLRTAIDNFSLWAYEVYEAEVRKALPEPHFAREDYIRLKNGWISERDFWFDHGRSKQMPEDKTLVTVAMLLLEAQYYIQEAQTSCATYWDDYRRPEVRIVLNAARRAMHLIYQATGFDYEPFLLEDLSSLGGYPPYMDTRSIAAISPSRFEEGYYTTYSKPYTDPLWQEAKQASYAQFAQWNKTHRLLERGKFNIDGTIRNKDGNDLGRGVNTAFLDAMHQALDEIFMYVFYVYLDVFLKERNDLPKAEYLVEMYRDGQSLAGLSGGYFTVDGSGSRNGIRNNYKWTRFVLLHEIGHNNKGRIFKNWSEEAADTYAYDALRHIEQINRKRYRRVREEYIQASNRYDFMDYPEWERQELLRASGRSDNYGYGCLALAA